jgi:hypothetical protein
MARTTAIDLGSLVQDANALRRDTERLVVEDDASWVDSEHFEALIRDKQADASLLDELDALVPDTIGDL